MSIPVSIPDAQLAFDIEGILRQAAVEAAPPWAGAPLHFTTAYYSPAELGAAFALAVPAQPRRHPRPEQDVAPSNRGAEWIQPR